MRETPALSDKKLPFWTWIVPLPVFFLGSEIAVLFNTLFGSSIFYLPLAFSIILIHWWGPRILLPLYLSYLFNSSEGLTIDEPLIGTHIVISAFISWWLFKKIAKGDCKLNGIQDLIKFSVLGLMVPIVINSFYFPFIYRVNIPDWQNYGTHATFIWLADFTTCFALVIPVLYFLTPVMDKLNLTLRHPFNRFPSTQHSSKLFTVDVVLVLVMLIILGITVDFKVYWFLFGIPTLYLAVRHGFEATLIGNLIIFIAVYVMPFIIRYPLDYTVLSENSLASIHLGMSLLYVSSALIGCVISDLKVRDTTLMNKNRVLEVTNDELNKVNQELDRFVYSVSHDLSAPLKTIKGLANISRIENDIGKIRNYVDLIDNRVQKLETFISEVIDYSRSNRKEISFESIDLKKLTDEILEMHADLQNFPEAEITKDFKTTSIISDRMLLKIILNNLISNAIKYHRNRENEKHFVSITSEQKGNKVLITVRDNGEGIPLELQSKIFNMFFRGTLNSEGSGLGLYIAKEAASRIQAMITVNSVVGQGSEFTVLLPVQPFES